MKKYSLQEISKIYQVKLAQQTETATRPEPWLKMGAQVWLIQGPLPEDYRPIVIQAVRMEERYDDLVWVIRYYELYDKSKKPRIVDWKPGIFRNSPP